MDTQKGKRMGQGKLAGAKRHKSKMNKEKKGGQHITNGDIRRLARRGGVKRISSDSYSTTRDVIVSFLQSLVKDAIIYTEHAQRNTVQAMDVVYALKKYGRNLLLNTD
ncbi:unnamed protein product [Paramecium sonneborni]|uniref:Transcription factor CBF/NF-Y/archaeal histone domain-containing protein n=1 Tax=Paramecium sonneborni TaxID=65129 RepID=A0A8S1KUA9_9CILI|nr:unnamed protein product [Paramecium sonneborni]